MCGYPLLGRAEKKEFCSNSQLTMSNGVEQLDTLKSPHSPNCGNGHPGSCKYWILDLGTNGKHMLVDESGLSLLFPISEGDV